MILLDTCVISEAMRPQPDRKVLAWLDSVPEHSVYLPALVAGELQKGIQLLEDGQKRQALQLWFEQLRVRFAGRSIGIDEQTGLIWGELSARLQGTGHSLPVTDGLLAACAIRHGAILATRNTADFQATGIHLLNPWD
ncbi:MAG: type II toxin-antitoxin system VapC family toxin [Spirochaetaceae bacterium]|nr:MAG: type II toxin-antitoxin system VapC family toxin [Spirochaetaceae bacterium]